MVEGGRIRGDRAIVVTAHLKADPSHRVTIKFFVAEEDFLHEAQLYELLPPGTAIPGIHLLFIILKMIQRFYT